MSTNNKTKKDMVNRLRSLRAKISDIKDFLKPAAKEETYREGCCECGSPTCMWNKYDNVEDGDFEIKPSDDIYGEAEFSDMSNVIFVPGTDTNDTKVYINNTDTQLHGVSKATLKYDAELGIPILKLEIVAPQVQR